MASPSPKSNRSSTDAAHSVTSSSDTTAPSAISMPSSDSPPLPLPPSSNLSSEKKQITYVTTLTPTAADLEAQTTPEPFKRFGLLRYTLLNVYRRLFTLCVLGNAIALAIILSRGSPVLDLVNASAINLAVCGLCRQPLIINILYLSLVSIPRSAPLRLRRVACKIFHLGGVHSGTGVASFLWYIAFTAVYTAQHTPSPTSTAALVLIYLVLACLALIILVAYPSFRSAHHDIFELTHRFTNWAVLLLFWGLLFLLATQSSSISSFLLPLPAFWVTTLLTLATVHPWLLLRRVRVVPEPLSPHAVRLHFAHTSVKFGQGIALATHPLADWHSFASFTDRFDSPGGSRFSCLVSRAGDWTRRAIAEQPTHLWKRGVPIYGFGYVMRMFRRIIVVTTGSGIGPCLSFIGDEDRPAMRVVWQTRSPVKTYGERTMELVRRMDAQPVIFDTSEGGRADMLPEILRLYKEFEAEAVCVISNPATTRDIVYRCELRGVPAYGPIFDS
ncbi:hypothetical protein B0T22DRAFT_476234 [Podospora appendiculata]|uniref:Integral membrane protein TmpA n=1 Tax=Podospora appendiculata TaxID=314037 RepID=A0AAE1CG58_9PEZI|nr:hypothetical protein B0T22DRAFT_476234 [Podospora appendiculata]